MRVPQVCRTQDQLQKLIPYLYMNNELEQAKIKNIITYIIYLKIKYLCICLTTYKGSLC